MRFLRMIKQCKVREKLWKIICIGRNIVCPPQAIVGGRYLVREFLEEQENQLVYLAYDLVEKKQVRLAECYPKALVQRKGEAGEGGYDPLPPREPKVEEIQRQFEKKYKQVIRDHHTVYAVLPLNKKKPMGLLRFVWL